MKKTLLYFCSLMAIFGCQIDELAPVAKDEVLTDGPLAMYTVGMEDDNDIETRTSLGDDEKTILWSEGDQMNIFFGVNNNDKDVLTLKGPGGSKTGKFYGPYISSEDDVENLHQAVIVYPFDEANTCEPNETKTEYTVGLTVPAVQNYVVGSMDNGALAMIGVTEKPGYVTIKTQNVLSGLKLYLKGDKKISKVVVAAEEIALAGPAKVLASYNNPPVITITEGETASNKVVMECGDGVQLNNESVTGFYLTFAPCVSDGKLSVTVYDTEGGYMTIPVPAATKFERSKFSKATRVYEPESTVQNDLVNAFSKGGNYTLPVDVTVDVQLPLTDKTLYLDLNGNTLNLGGSQSATQGHIKTTRGHLYISNGTITGKQNYMFVTSALNGNANNLSLNLDKVNIVCTGGVAVFGFPGETNVKLTDVNVESTKTIFRAFKDGSKGRIVIDGGRFKSSSAIFQGQSGDFTIPVTFNGDCRFSDMSYKKVNWNEIEDADATCPYVPESYVVFVGEDGFYTLEDAMAFAKEGDKIVLYKGTYTMKSPKTGITYCGKEDGVVIDVKDITPNLGGGNLSFENVTLEFSNKNYKGFQHAGEISYKGCNIVGQPFLYGVKATFDQCVFVQTSSDAYNVWTYGVKEVTFNECTFNSAGKSVLIYSDQPSVVQDVTFNNCVLNASVPVDGKAAIEVDASLVTKYTIKINDTVANGFAKGTVSKNTLWNPKKGAEKAEIFVDDINVCPGFTKVSENEYNVYNAIGLKSLSDKKFSDVTLNIMQDIDMVNEEFKAIAANYGKTLTINGNNKTIKNVKVVSGSSDNTTGQASMFYTYTGSTLTVENLKFENVEVDADINGSGYAAVVVGYAEGNVVLNNVDVVSCDVYGEKSCGALVGFITGTGSANYDGCDVVESMVEAKEDRTGAYVGRAAGSLTVTNCTVDEFDSVAPDGWANTYIGQRYTNCPTCTIDGKEYVDAQYGLSAAIAKATEGATIILASGTYSGLFDFTGKTVTVEPVMDANPTIEGLVWVNNSNVTLKGLTLSNPNGVQHPNPTNSDYFTTINKQYPVIGAYLSSKINVVGCTMNLTGPTVYGFYGYAENSPVFEGCTFNCNKIRPIANNGDAITVTGCTFVDQYHYSVRIFENSGQRQTVVYTNNTVTGTNDKGEFEGVNISKKGGTATIFADFTINGNTEGLKYRHHKAVTMDPSCTYDVTGFAFEKEN